MTSQQRPDRIGVGLPAAVPGTPASAVGIWAARAEQLGFGSLGVLDRLVYENLDPLIALTAAAERTERIELLTTILTVPFRQNAVLLAKQIGSLDQISQGRLTTGLALGGWPQDFDASGLSGMRRGAAFDEMLATMRRVWGGDVPGASGPIPALPPGRPRLLFGGFVEASFTRAARLGDGWVAPFFGIDALRDGAGAARAAWTAAGRSDAPRITAERYFCLGDGAGEIADEYIAHYYGREFFDAARADTLATEEELAAEAQRVSEAGATDLLLFPCSGDIRQLELLAGALTRAGILKPRSEEDNR